MPVPRDDPDAVKARYRHDAFSVGSGSVPLQLGVSPLASADRIQARSGVVRNVLARRSRRMAAALSPAARR
jgi:hypothetical protein